MIRNFIVVTGCKSRSPAAIAIDKITTITVDWRNHRTTIYTVEAMCVECEETVDQVLALIDKASHDPAAQAQN